MIIGVVSLARAGKDTFADYLVSNYGFNKINTSDVLHDYFIKNNEKPTKDKMSILADKWRKESGCMDIVTQKSLNNINPSLNYVITGFRSKQESDLMRKKFPESFLISIICDKELRYSRRTDIDPQTKKGFFGRDERDIENKGLAKVIVDADYYLMNNSSLQDFHDQIKNFMKKIKR